MKTFIYYLIVLYLLYYGANLLYDLFIRRKKEGKESLFEESEFEIGEEFYGISPENEKEVELEIKERALGEEKEILTEDFAQNEDLSSNHDYSVPTESLQGENRKTAPVGLVPHSMETENSSPRLSSYKEDETPRSLEKEGEKVIHSSAKKTRSKQAAMASTLPAEKPLKSTNTNPKESAPLDSSSKTSDPEVEDPRERIARLFPEFSYKKEPSGRAQEVVPEVQESLVEKESPPVVANLNKDQSQESEEMYDAEKWNKLFALAETSITVETSQGVKIYQSTLAPNQRKIVKPNP